QFKMEPCREVELGCGTGSNSVWLARQGFAITGIDISPTAIGRARARAAAVNAQVSFVQADVTQPLGLGKPFEFFFDPACYHAVRRGDAVGFLKTLNQITAPGSIGIVLAGNAREARKPGPPAVSEEMIRVELGRDFDILSLEEFRFDQDEPDGYRPLGWSSVLQKPIPQ